MQNSDAAGKVLNFVLWLWLELIESQSNKKKKLGSEIWDENSLLNWVSATNFEKYIRELYKFNKI